MNTARRLLNDTPATLLESLQPSTIWNSPAFASLWKTVGGMPVVWTVDHDGVAAALVGVEFGASPVRRFQAMPDGCYARPRYANAVETAAPLGRILAEAIRDHGYAKAILSDYHGYFSECDGFERTVCQTALVDISAPDWEPPDAKLRSQIRKAEREGIAVVPFEAGSHLDPFMRLAQSTEDRHGRDAKYPREFFEELAELAARDERVIWLWCEHDGLPAASHIRFLEGDSLICWQSYYDKAFSFLKPNQYMIHTLAKQQARGGAKTLNLGSWPEGADGLVAFKKRWGAEIVSYDRMTCRSKLGRLF